MKPDNPYRVKAASNGGVTTLSIFGSIGADPWADESVAAIDVVKQLSDAPGDIDVRINSYGGSVSDGLAIHNALANHQRGTVSTHVDGVAYSIANLIVMGATPGHRNMAASSLAMVHAPWGFTVGNAADHRDQAETLDRHSQAMAAAYTRHGIGDDVVAGWLSGDRDHFFTPDEAIDAGLADNITSPVPTALAMARSFDIDRRPNIQKPHANHKQEAPMPTEAKKKPEAVASAPVSAPVVDVVAIAAQAVAAETTRCAQIRAYAQPHAAVDGIDALALTAQGDPAVTAADFGLQVLAHLGKHAGDPVGSGIQSVPGGDSRDKFITGAEAAIMMRAGQLSMTDKAVQGNEFNGMRLVEIARHAGKLAGIDTGGTVEAMLKSVMAAGNHSSSDFPLILENIANKTMLRGWEESDESYREWVNNGTLPDFKVSKRVDLNLFGNLPTVPEGGEYSYGTIGERGESVVLLKIGRLFSITWEAIINDDMDAFTKIPDRMIRAADRTVGGMVYAQLTTNPLMSDGIPLFDAAHSNLLTGSALDTAAVSAMRTAMALQKDPDDIAATGLNIRLQRLIVPVALADQAATVANSEFVVGSAAEPSRIPNVVRGAFEITSDARLDADDPGTWYGAAGSNMDLIEVSTLAGQSMPTMTREDGFNVDGMTLKIRHAVGVKALDYRTFQKNPGA